MSDVQTQSATVDARTTRRAKLIINPAAFQGSDGTSSETYREELTRLGIQTEIAPTTEEDHGTGLARAAKDEGFDLVIAAGGDGTIHDVAKGLIGSDVPLGILPLGTMNNIARSLAIPTKLEDACALIATGTPRAVDIGVCNGDAFLEAVSIGVEAPLFPLSESMRHSGIFGLVRGMIAGLRILAQSQLHPLTIEMDGHRRLVRARQVTICNAPFYGMGFSAAPGARMDDGKLDVAISRYARRRDMLIHYWSLATGQRELRTMTKTYRAKRIRIGGGDPLPVAVDGVAAGQTPVRLMVRPGALRVFAPAGLAAANTPEGAVGERLWRVIAPREPVEDDKVYAPADQMHRLKLLNWGYWLALAIFGAATSVARWFRWWPFAPRQTAMEHARRPVADGRHTWNATLLALVALFLRLRMPLSALAALAGEGSLSLAWLLRRARPDLPPANTTAMRAVAGMGALATGLWVSRKATWRRNILLAGLTWMAGWFSLTSRPTADPPLRRHEGMALGIGVGAAWLGVMIAVINVAERSLFKLTHTKEEVAALQVSPPTVEANTTAPPPQNPALDQAIVPVSVKQPLERGDIVLFGPDGSFGAAMIAFFTNSRYHHVALYDGEGMVIEAMPGGVRRYLLGARRVTGVRPLISPAQRRTVADWARARIGSPYDTRGLALIAFDRLFPGLRLGTSSVSRFSCAVFVADAYLHAGVDLLPGQRWQDLVPGDFVTLMDTPPRT